MPVTSTAPESTSAVERWLAPRAALAYVLPLAFALLVHAKTIGFPFVPLDDPMHCTANPLVVAPFSAGWLEQLLTRQIGYPIPITVGSYAIDHALFGFEPAWFHLVNLLVHLANVALVVALGRCVGLGRWAALLAGAWFAVHPLVVEPVSWVTGRKDLLAAGFGLAALSLVADRRVEEVGPGRWAGALALALVAMLSKVTAISLPILLWVAASHRTDPVERRRALAATATGVALSGAVFWVGLQVVRQQQYVDRATLVDRLNSAVGAWTLSLRNVVWPLDLAPYYFQFPGDPSVVAMVLAVVVLVAAVVAYFKWLPGGSPERVALAWAAWAYAPVSGVAGHARWTSDSYLYLSLAGLCIAAAALLERTLAARPVGARFGLGLAAALALVPLSAAQGEIWRHPDQIWRTVVARYPQSPVAVSELAATLKWMGRPTEARETYVLLDQRFPDFEQRILPRVEARLASGEVDRATELMRRGIAQGDESIAAAYLRLVVVDPAFTPDVGDLRAAFDLAWPALMREVVDPGVFRGLAVRLHQAGLTDRARRAAERYQTLNDPGGGG